MTKKKDFGVAYLVLTTVVAQVALIWLLSVLRLSSRAKIA